MSIPAEHIDRLLERSRTPEAEASPQRIPDDHIGQLLERSVGPPRTTADPAVRLPLQASAEPPEQVARTRAVAKELDLPEYVVGLDLPHFEQELKARQIEQSDAYQTREAMTDPAFAAVAKDDFDTLAMLERSARALPAGLFRLSEGIYGTGESFGRLLQTVTRPAARAGLFPVP